jgi:hypothetical protein
MQNTDLNLGSRSKLRRTKSKEEASPREEFDQLRQPKLYLTRKLNTRPETIMEKSKKKSKTNEKSHKKILQALLKDKTMTTELIRLYTSSSEYKSAAKKVRSMKNNMVKPPFSNARNSYMLHKSPT